MNGDRAKEQLERIRAMVKESGADCTIEVVRGELDSVHLTFHCGGKRHSVAWVGAWLETLTDDNLWRELYRVTLGGVNKPTTRN